MNPTEQKQPSETVRKRKKFLFPAVAIYDLMSVSMRLKNCWNYES